ncbi:MAG TPA: hypothetical protein VNZ64_21920 [Candidatus Acidoferrum sp.]|nr:hypothetical protein [Candidatus Acidoferrum sp.]
MLKPVLLAFLFSSALPAFSAPDTASHTTVIIVVGAPGDPEFGSNFVRQADLWTKACSQANCRHVTIGLDTESQTNDYDRLKLTLAAEPRNGLAQLWLVLLGHGTFDGKEARFNLRGPDFSATELALWLQPFHRPLAVLNTASASAPFLNKLSATNRVIITATRSGYEQNYTRFGQFLAEAITSSEADLDKDGQVSLLEAFLTASRQVAEFYKVEGRLASEHALLDDNGDGLGTPADWFRGLRATKRPKENTPLDGLLARQFYLVNSDTERTLTMEQRTQRDQLERAVLLFRDKKGESTEDEYYRQLEALLLPLAQFYSSNSIDTVLPRPDPPSPTAPPGNDR